MSFERRSRRVERLRRPAEVARTERDFSLCDDAPCTGDGLLRTKGARRVPDERPGSHEIAELRHRDASQRKRRRIVAQRDTLQRAERITGGQRTCRGRDRESILFRETPSPGPLHTPAVAEAMADRAEALRRVGGRSRGPLTSPLRASTSSARPEHVEGRSCGSVAALARARMRVRNPATVVTPSLLMSVAKTIP